MIELTGAQLSALLPLFLQKDTHIVAQSCCRGLVPCRAFADHAEHPTAGVVALSRFGIGCVAGDASHAHELLEALRGWHPWYHFTDPPQGWHPALAAWSKQGYAFSRYAFTNDPGGHDKERLRQLAIAPEGCEMRLYDRAIAEQALAAEWSEDQLGGFESVDAFLEKGLGVALLRDGQLVAGCASFCRHQDGYEIQVDTREDHRGKGYAACVSAAFMLEALSRGMTPYWDAANASSLRLALKLGYALDRAYTAWMLVASKENPDAIAQKVIGG